MHCFSNDSNLQNTFLVIITVLSMEHRKSNQCNARTNLKQKTVTYCFWTPCLHSFYLSLLQALNKIWAVKFLLSSVTVVSKEDFKGHLHKCNHFLRKGLNRILQLNRYLWEKFHSAMKNIKLTIASIIVR